MISEPKPASNNLQDTLGSAIRFCRDMVPSNIQGYTLQAAATYLVCCCIVECVSTRSCHCCGMTVPNADAMYKRTELLGCVPCCLLG